MMTDTKPLRDKRTVPGDAERTAATVPPPRQRPFILVAIILWSLLTVLDSATASITLPHMQGSLSATQDQVSWVMTAFFVAVVITVPLTGELSARIGRKRLLLISVSGFTIAAICVAQSTSLPEIVVFRFIQGCFGAGLIPMGQATLLDTYPSDEIGMAMGWRSMGITMGMCVGPLIGGYVTEYLDWRWGFYVNLPISVAAVVMIFFFVPESTRRRDDPLNWFGFLMLAIGLGSLQLMLNQGQRMDWFASAEIVAAAAVAAVSLYLFAVHWRLARRPFIDPAIFKDRNLSTTLVLVFAIVWPEFSTIVLLPAFMQDVGGFPVSDAGKVMAVRAAGIMLISVVAGRMLQRFEPRPIIALGVLLIAAAEWQMSLFTPDVSLSFILVTAAIFGAGVGFAIVPLNVTAFYTLAPDRRGLATSVYSLATMLGASTGISVMVTLLVASAQANHSILVEHLTPYNEVIRHGFLPLSWSLADPAGLAVAAEEINRQALMIAYVNDFRILALLTLISLPLVYFIRKPRAQTIAEARRLAH